MSMTPVEASEEARNICGLAPVVPVLVVSDAGSAADLGAALVNGGLPALEGTRHQNVTYLAQSP